MEKESGKGLRAFSLLGWAHPLSVKLQATSHKLDRLQAIMYKIL